MQYSEAALQQVREDRFLIDEVDKWLYEEIAPFIGQRVLEMGCGVGNFAKYMTERACYVGVDIEPSSVAVVQENFGNYANMSAFTVDVTQISLEQFSPYQFDTVFTLNVFEHIEDDVQALANAYDLLQPNGYMILVVPAHQQLHGRIDDAIGHYRRYSKRSARERLESVGFTVTKQKYINAVGALGWFVSSRIMRHDVPPSGQLKAFNRLVPLLKQVERVIPVPFGISVLSVAQKLNA